jgi:ABC-type amino acid transport substrate-binding protein
LAIPLSDDLLGWGVRRGDRVLLESVNTILDGWKKDGTLDEIIGRWIPHLKPGK